MFASQSDNIICSAPLFRAGPDKLSVVICVNLCPFACPACPVAPGDGTGVAPKDGTGAVPKARELFDTLGFKVRDFSTSVSITGSGDVWMSYVLDKGGRGNALKLI
jgi:hypothetical protein